MRRSWHHIASFSQVKKRVLEAARIERRDQASWSISVSLSLPPWANLTPSPSVFSSKENEVNNQNLTASRLSFEIQESIIEVSTRQYSCILPLLPLQVFLSCPQNSVHKRSQIMQLSSSETLGLIIQRIKFNSTQDPSQSCASLFLSVFSQTTHTSEHFTCSHTWIFAQTIQSAHDEILPLLNDQFKCNIPWKTLSLITFTHSIILECLLCTRHQNCIILFSL